MDIVRRFLIAELLWAAGIFMLVLPITILGADPGGAAEYVSWLGRALAFAVYAAGIAIAGDVRASVRPGRTLLLAFASVLAPAFAVFAIHAFVVPSIAGVPTLGHLAVSPRAYESWEMRNHVAWVYRSTLLSPLTVVLLAAIGVQVGLWTRHALPESLHRPLYWIAGLGLIVSGYSVFDTTYETVVLHTAADASFAAFYTILVPASICAGLALPTLALLRSGEIRRSSG